MRASSSVGAVTSRAGSARGERRPWLFEILQAHASRRPNAVAILGPDRTPLTYGGLFTLVRLTGRRLRALGVRQHTRVVTVLPEGPEALTCVVAVATWATAAPLNPAYGQAELTAQFARLRADAVLVPSGDDGPAALAAGALGIPVIRVGVDVEAPAGAFRLEGSRAKPGRPESAARDGAFLFQTGGSTGRPKMVALSHRQVAASVEDMVRCFRLRPDDRCFAVMPMFHVHGLIGAALTSLRAGAAVVCPPAFYPPRFGRWMIDLGATWMTAAPAVYRTLLHYGRAELVAVRRRHRLRFIRSCSAPLPSPLAMDLEELLNVPVIEAYGMTEAAHQITCNPLPPGHRKIGSVGRPVGPEVAIIDADGQRTPDGVPGEIILRGPSVITHYDSGGDGAASEHHGAFIRGWLRTADLGALDQEGYLSITGRLKDMINRGGEKIWPSEIEEVLLRHPAVLDAAAFPIPHPLLGEVAAAAVVLRSPNAVRPSGLSAFAASHLSGLKQPQEIVILDRIPRTRAGKLDRSRFAAILGFTRRE